MSEYVIVTDSSADLTVEQIRDMDVMILPLSFTIQGSSFQDTPAHEDMALEEFYRLIRAGETPTTNAVNMGQYEDLLTPVLENGKDVLVLAFSSGLSSTCQAAQMAAVELRAKFPERKVEVVDTLCASMGQGLLTWYAAHQRKAGASLEEVRDWCENNKRKLCHWFTVDDLMHLKRGGRVSAATAVMGTMLQIKPILHVDNEGRLVNMEKARGRKASLDVLVQKAVDTAMEPEKQTMFLSHSDCLEDAQYVADQIQARCGTKKFAINFIGPVIGSHTGCGCVALFFVGRER